MAVGGGGWDWFAVNLDDGTDLTVTSFAPPTAATRCSTATFVGADGTLTNRRRRLHDHAAGQLDESRDRRDYPAGWRVAIPAQAIDITLTPTVADQELDTRATTGVVYWEGSQSVTDSA